METAIYYSDKLTTDDEGNLVILCGKHAVQHESDVSYATNIKEPDLVTCELCDA